MVCANETLTLIDEEMNRQWSVFISTFIGTFILNDVVLILRFLRILPFVGTKIQCDLKSEGRHSV